MTKHLKEAIEEYHFILDEINKAKRELRSKEMLAWYRLEDIIEEEQIIKAEEDARD